MGAQLTTDKLAPGILVMQEHILLLKCRRGEFHYFFFGGHRGQTFEWERAAAPTPTLEPPHGHCCPVLTSTDIMSVM